MIHLYISPLFSSFEDLAPSIRRVSVEGARNSVALQVKNMIDAMYAAILVSAIKKMNDWNESIGQKNDLRNCT